MANALTAGELRKALQASNAKWTVDERLKDSDVVKTYPTGGDLTQAVKVTSVERIDITPFISTVSSNPFLRQLRVDRGLLQLKNLPVELQSPINLKAPVLEKPILGPEALPVGKLPVEPVKPPVPEPAPAPAAGAGASAAVDWRNRFGWPWLTKIKDQGPCESCWVFSAVGVVEAMTRIEHSIWSLRSEGDVHDGLGASCGTTGWPTTAFNWMKTNGVADPGSWPYETSNEAYKPTSDRDGRTVKLADYVTLSNIQDQKSWIDNVGPLSACFTVYNDFFGYGPNSGVYTANTSTGVAGGHCIVIVGYDDSKQAWLIRNSWNTGWGMEGYGWFGYGQADIDNNAKFGVPGANVNPDPWTKRRSHNGSLYESGDGSLNRNFELWTQAPGNAIRHYWRDGVSLNWSLAETVGNDCAASPCARGTTYNRNFEYIYRTTGSQLHHRYYDQSAGQWDDGGVFGPNDVTGAPGFIQSNYGAPGNFEVVFRVTRSTIVVDPNPVAAAAAHEEKEPKAVEIGKLPVEPTPVSTAPVSTIPIKSPIVNPFLISELQHYWRNNSGGNVWNAGPLFGSGIEASGASLIQRFDNGLDVIAVDGSGVMQRYWRNDPAGAAWQACETFGSGVSTAPVMIQGMYNATDETVPGNYELCVAVNGAIQHWYTAAPKTATTTWAMSASFGSGIKQVLGLIQSSFGFNLELIALLNDGSLQHFWRDSSNLVWQAGPIVGSTVS
ncbi:C1 family peptidase [Paracidobacterium acidisoli]|uniref:Peptidase C1A n=1 Tax=Paracidobacterium acidisoli TaxID=2303751 RepID=A0A372IRI9_9BACT|nr:C1 family peptidase [Paracidobacterium acidisoli]MBT9330403.1 C1 family peptidase [Paracidobacterium acidisoli]